MIKAFRRADSHHATGANNHNYYVIPCQLKEFRKSVSLTMRRLHSMAFRIGAARDVQMNVKQDRICSSVDKGY